MLEIRKLLFVTKFEELCFDALQTLLNLRQAALNHVVFINVIERDRVTMRRGTGYQKDEEIRLRERANIRFINWAERLFEQGMEVGNYIVKGRLVPEVIKAAQMEQTDLIVIGRSDKGMLEQLYGGSEVMELIRRTAIPVLVYKHLADGNQAAEEPFKRPLLATDWSPASIKAAEYLKPLKGVAKEVSVVHVVGDEELKGQSAFDVQKARKQTRMKLDAICDELESDGVLARPYVYVGDPVQELERAARECQATMIVLGSSGKAAWKEKFIGSIPRTIAEKSAYATLLIPPEKL